MVSFQAPLSPTGIRKSIPVFLDHNSSKKRKWDENQPTDHQESLKRTPKPDITKSFYEIELHLETPLPLEWQRCLDIQSGQIHFYNTRTHKRTSRDPRSDPEPSPGHMSLELELNLPCESQRKTGRNDSITKHGSGGSARNTSICNFLEDSFKKDHNKGSEGLMMKRSPSWIAAEGNDVQQQEMMATVCTKCHMLVMLCKTSPSCPNCKFIHPPDQNPPMLFKQRLSLFC